MVMNNIRKETKYIVVHSTNTNPEQNLDVKDLDKQHRKEGLFSCAFHKVIKRDGSVQDGRDIMIAGAHIETDVVLSNKNSIGICLVGGHNVDGQPDCNFTFKQYESLVKLIDVLKANYKEVEIVGHRDVSDASCPQFDVKQLLT
ncbi:lysozyme [Pelagibacter phage Eistla EXVC025P]|nr:lysozyme [Pelagibacter phage Eistla EXVC025P]